jgi:hypothetical protein
MAGMTAPRVGVIDDRRQVAVEREVGINECGDGNGSFQ